MRVTLVATLGTARIPLRVDIGIGDAVTPAPVAATFPTLLDFSAPRVRAYPAETVVAEKFHAMVTLGIANTRMKDFYDVWLLSETRSLRRGDTGRRHRHDLRPAGHTAPRRPAAGAHRWLRP